MVFNDKQTQITDQLKKELDKEVYSEVLDCISSIQFVKNLISGNRRRVAEVEKDSEGKIIVDLTNPHILEDMDYFRQPAIHFQQHGKYTLLHPNKNPSSEYYRFWREEAIRCREGLIREDGEWIPGPYYYYLNYSPILLSKIVKGKKRASRVRDFPFVYDGDYLFFHYVDKAKENIEHSNLLKKRGAGFSFKIGSGLSRVFILGDTEETKSNATALAIANEKEYLVKDGVLNKFIDNVDWCSKHTPWPRIRGLKDSLQDMHWIMGYKTKESSEEQGVLNEVMGITLKNDPDKARGKRAVYIYWDETGKFDDFLKAWEVAIASTSEGEIAFGIMLSGGTGGAEVKSFRGEEEIFYNPAGHHVYAVPNVYDRGARGITKCAFFFPEYLNRFGYFDKDGNSDVIGALISIFNNRVKIKYGSSDPNTLMQEKAERPITPMDALARREGSIFPVGDLKDYKAEIIPNKNKFLAPHYVGHLVVKMGGGVEWRPEQQHPVIREWPIDKDMLDKTGCVEIFELPKKSTEGEVVRGRYIAAVDPIDYDAPLSGGSLGSMFVLDLWTDRVVAEYTGRPNKATDFYETCLRLAMFFNAEINYENNLKGLFAYFDQHRALQYLCDTPQILRDMEFVKDALYGNRAKGTHANKFINSWSRKLQADWMVTPAYQEYQEPELDEKGNLIEKPTKLNLHNMRSLGYIDEAISWNPDDNFDRVSAMGMLMILREDRIKYTVKGTQEHVKTIVDDPWFYRSGGFKRKNDPHANILEWAKKM